MSGTTGISIIWGGAAAAIVTAVAVIASALISRKIKIAEFRQAWIDALREDIAAYLRTIDTIYYRFGMTARPGADTDDLEKLEDARNQAMLAYRRILLRLNITEKAHMELAQQLNGLQIVKTKTADSAQIDKVIRHAREVLRHEWAVTKYGMFAPAVLMVRGWIKESVGQGAMTRKVRFPPVLHRPRAFWISLCNVAGLACSLAGLLLLFYYALPNEVPGGPVSILGNNPSADWEQKIWHYNKYAHLGLALALIGTIMEAVPPACTAIASARRRRRILPSATTKP